MPINTPHADYGTMAPRWKRCRDVSAGQDAVHVAGILYLPKLKDQSEDDYKAYVMRATFYNATWRTIVGLIGMMLRQPPAVEAPENVKLLLDDVDAAGEPMQLFSQNVCEQALTVGRLGILVDVPAVVSAEGKAPTLADARAQNIRPTMQLYRAESIINWKTGRYNNQTVLTLVVLKEVEEIAVDEWSTKNEDRWRELSLVNGKYRVRVFKKKDNTQGVLATDFEQIGNDIFPVMEGKTMDFIPFVFLGTDDTSCDVDEPPLIDLVNVNLSHYRTQADYAHGCHFTGLPTLFLAGFKKEMPDEKIYIGSEAAIVSANENAKATFVEFTGQGLQSLKEKLDREEQHMAVLGARMLEPQKKAQESPDSASIRRKGEEAMLSSVAQAISLGLTQCLKWFCMFAGTPEVASVKYELNRDFYPMKMDSVTLTALVGAWQQGAISYDTLFKNLQQGEIIDQETTAEEEQSAVEQQQQTFIRQQADAAAAVAAVGGGPTPGA